MDKKPTYKPIIEERQRLNRSYLKIKARLTNIGVMATKLGLNNDKDHDDFHSNLLEHYQMMGEWIKDVDALYEKTKESYHRVSKTEERSR